MKISGFEIKTITHDDANSTVVFAEVEVNDKQFSCTAKIDKEGVLVREEGAFECCDSLDLEEDLLIECLQKKINYYAEGYGFISWKTQDEIIVVGYATEINPANTGECDVLVSWDERQCRMDDDYVEDGDIAMTEECFINSEGVDYVVYQPYDKNNWVR